MTIQSKSGGRATYEESLPLPIEAIWHLLRNFGKWNTWSPFLLDLIVLKRVPAESPEGTPDVLPSYVQRQYRSLSDDVVKKRFIEETTLIDDQNKVLKYHMIQNSNPHIRTIETTISLKPDDTNPKNVKITWESTSSLDPEGKVESIAQEMDNIWKHVFGEEQVPGSDVHPLDRLVTMQTRLYKMSVYGISMNLLLEHYKEEAFRLINHKILIIGGQFILGNNPDNAKEYQYTLYDLFPESMPKQVQGLPMAEVLPPKKFALILKRLLEMTYMSVASFFGGYAGELDYGNAALALAKQYGSEQEFKMTVDLSRKWDKDEEFCSQLLQGVNPMMIKRVKDFGKEVPATMSKLTVTDDGQEITVEALAKEGRLFIVDYEDLDDLPKKNKNMYFYAPYLLVYKKKNESQLNIAGIQLERKSKKTDGSIPVYTPNKTPANLWKLAKMFVQSADSQVHEFRYHLGLSHLSQEPTVIAVHNRLPETHAIRKLLQPHLDETIGINFLARQTLIASDFAFTDRTFVVGTENGVRLSAKAWRDYHFINTSFPEQLKARGFDREQTDGLQTYYYRDDGFKLWDCMGNYATNVVNATYKTDADVANDKDIQAWAAEMISVEKANVKGFPKEVKTKAVLSHVCQIIIWNGSALHSLINYPQWPYLGFIKNRPNGLYQPMPEHEEGQEDITKEYIDKALLPTFESLFQILFSWLLSAQQTDTTLIHLNVKDFDPAVNQKFQSELKGLADFINERNKKLESQQKTPYIYCLPENVACSVNI